MSKKHIDLPLSHLAYGAIQEKLDGELQKVFDNIHDPNPVALSPYRAFLEVEQPVSDFIFRMKDGPRGATFEADGGAWRNEAIASVRDYPKEELREEINKGAITIIA